MLAERIVILGVYLTALVKGGGTTWNGPSSEAAVVGNQVVMSCQPPVEFDSVDWYFTAFRSVDRSLVSRGEQVFNNFKEFSVATRSVSGQELTLESARMTHAGIYACSVFQALSNGTGRTIESTAHLTVLETVPECRMNETIVKEGDYVHIECRVKFNGSLVPVMQWYAHRAGDDDDDKGFVMKDGHSQTIVQENTVTSAARIVVDYRLNNSSYSCHVYFQPPSQPFIVNASNAPRYNYTWNSPFLQVHFGPKEMTILPRKNTYEPGDALICDAKSSPTPRFEWKNLETKEIIEGPELIIRSSMKSQQQHSFNCKARNDLTDKELTSDSIVFQVSSNERIVGVSLETFMLIAVSVSVVFVIFVVVLVVYIVYLKKRGNRRGNREGGTNDRAPVQNTATISTPASNNSDANHTDYSEIPFYSTCREAMERSNYRGPSSSNTAPAYLQMSSNSSNSNGSRTREKRQEPRCRSPIHCYQNNIYMEPDENEDASSARYSIVLRSTKSDETSPRGDANSHSNEHKNSNSLHYTTLTRSVEEIGNRKEQKPVEEEQNDYLVPLSIS